MTYERVSNHRPRCIILQPLLAQQKKHRNGERQHPCNIPLSHPVVNVGCFLSSVSILLARVNLKIEVVGLIYNLQALTDYFCQHWGFHIFGVTFFPFLEWYNVMASVPGCISPNHGRPVTPFWFRLCGYLETEGFFVQL